VAGGIYVRRHYSTIVGPASRIQGRAVWDLLLFGLNSLIFLLLGAEFGNLVEGVPASTLVSVGTTGLLIGGLVILVRLIWVPLAAAIPRRLSPSLRARDPMPPPAAIFIVSWTGMRGVVSLAAALGLPLLRQDGTAVPFRAEIVLVTVTVILVTLVLQGLTLMPLYSRLKLPREEGPAREEAHARMEAGRAALEHLADVSQEEWTRKEDLAQLEAEFRRVHPAAGDGRGEERTRAIRRVRLGALAAKRRVLIRLRDEGAISDEVLLDLESELDYEALRLGAGEQR
jgi:CPA1 family monovalent cation:H+ antiporter